MMISLLVNYKIASFLEYAREGDKDFVVGWAWHLQKVQFSVGFFGDQMRKITKVRLDCHSFLINLHIIAMLGDELNRPKNVELSRSSIMGEQPDQKRLREMIEERDRTIRKLSKKIDKLQATLKKTTVTKTTSLKNQEGSNEENDYFQMLKAEVNKTKHLEDIIKDISQRVNLILADLSQDNSFTDNSEELRQMLEELELRQNQTVSEEEMSQQQQSFSISQEWTKNIDILQGAIRSVKSKCIGYKQETKTMGIRLEEANKKIEQLQYKLNANEELIILRADLKQQRKQRQKLRGLLDRTEYQKNQLLNKISNIGLKQAQIKAKTKDELLQYSKQLNYRIKDLQKEKEDIMKQTNKQKETEMKKYQDVLKKLRSIKETSRMGRSFA